MAGYLGQHVDYVYGTVDAAVMAFAEEEADLIPSALSGVDALLNEVPDDAVRHEVLLDLHWGAARHAADSDLLLRGVRSLLAHCVKAVG